MKSARPFPIRLAEAGLLLLTLSGIVQAVRLLPGAPVWHVNWLLPGGIAAIAGAVLIGLHQGRAIARPLAMVAFGAIAIRGMLSLVDRGFPRLTFDARELLAIVLTVSAVGLAAWFGLSRAASRDLART
jgi:hypothetical protein